MEESGHKVERVIIAYEWGRTAKGDPIPRPHNVEAEISTEILTPAEIATIEECGNATLVLSSRGTLYASGSNKYGILGLPDKSLQDESKELEEIKFEKTSISDISVGSKHVLALTPEGKVYSWGSNNYGQIGKQNQPKPKSLERGLEEQAVPIGEAKNKVVSTPVQIAFDSPISEILAIENSSYALDEQGTVWSWGREQYIGRASGETMEENDDGDMMKVPANHIPRKVKIVNQEGTMLKIRHIARKGKKIVAYLEGDTPEKSETSIVEAPSEGSRADISKYPDSSYLKPSIVQEKKPGEESSMMESGIRDKVNKSKIIRKQREAEHEQAEYNILKELIAECKLDVIKPLMAFQRDLQERVDDFDNFTENPFGDILDDDDKKNATGLANLRKKPLHIDLKKGISELELIYRNFNELKAKYTNDINEIEGNRYSEILHFLLRNLEDSIKLRKLALLAFKLHGYHLRLKHKNVLSLASSSLLNEWDSVTELSKRMKDILGECEYITKRFSSLQGELNKAYDDKVNSLVSRTAYHMIDTTYSECQAWKYMNIIGQYAVIYRIGYENFHSVSEKMARLYGMYTELKKGDACQVSQAYKTAVVSAEQKAIIEKGRTHIISTNELIIEAKSEICISGRGEDISHKQILAQAYEILVDSAILRIAYYDLFLSYYDQLVKTQGVKQANATTNITGK